MNPLNTSKVHVRDEIQSYTELFPRRYTLTHSDFTGELFLTIAKQFDNKQISKFYTRLMRDEVLAEWLINNKGNPELHLYLQVSGGIVFGTARIRDRIFRHHLPLVLEVIRYGDQKHFNDHPELDEAPIIAHFNSPRRKFNRIEEMGTPSDFISFK
ncbi:MAG: hypothetical protein FK734_17835 [Asgard group archaeon]|nr:hypothetical protein [Asgard group archaeon]